MSIHPAGARQTQQAIKLPKFTMNLRTNALDLNPQSAIVNRLAFSRGSPILSLGDYERVKNRLVHPGNLHGPERNRGGPGEQTSQRRPLLVGRSSVDLR